MTEPAKKYTAPKLSWRLQDRLRRLLIKRRWHIKRDTFRFRLYHLLTERHRWYDWGHRLMILTGMDVMNSFDEPTPPTWYYRKNAPTRMRFTGYPRHPLSTYTVIKNYREFMAIYEPLNEDERYEWQAISTDQDGNLILGHRYWGGNFYSLDKWDQALLRKYLRSWRRTDWWGLRSWLYTLGLHAAVHQRKPLSCQAVPPRGSGGYSHWHCTLKRGHKSPHRFNAYEWTAASKRVEHKPTAGVSS